VHNSFVLVFVVLIAIGFDFTNGFHDTANAVAPTVATGALKPRTAVILSSVLNLVGAFLSLKVAATIASGIVSQTSIILPVVFGGLAGAIAWNVTTWYFGIPSSSSHALIGGLCGATFASDDDPELIKAAVPFSLKLMESLLEANPRHEGLLLTTSRGFTQFAYAFVQEDADETEDKDLTAAEEMRGRARRLYLRARNYGLRGLDVRHKGFEKALRANPKTAVTWTTVKDVPLLYWTAISWAATISLSKDKPDMIAEMPFVEAMMERALALDEAFDCGAIHTYFITYEMGRSGGAGDPAARSRQHFERALALSGGQQAGPMVTFAEAVCVQKQDLKQFEASLQQALSLNLEVKPEWRLVNLVMQRRAKWLLSRTDQLFLRSSPAESKDAK